MTAMYIEGTDVEVRVPTLAQRVQDMARGADSWTRVAEAALEEFVVPLRVLGFAALERASLDEPFKTVLSYQLPFLKVGKVGPRATIGSFVEAAATPGKVFVTEDVAGTGALACATLPTGSGSQQLIVLAARTPALKQALLGQFANQLLELVWPAVGGVAARPPADAVSIAIRRAKREWEVVADALPAMVGLADASGHVLRVNRAWTRGRRKRLGRSMHSLLHPDCDAPDCRFARTLASAIQQLPTREKLVVKTRDKERDGVWAVFLRYIAAREPRAARIVFSISKLPEAAVLATPEEAVPTPRSQQDLEQLLVQHHRLLDVQRQRFAGDLQRSLGQSLSAARKSIDRAMAALRGDDNGVVLDELDRSVALIEGVVQHAQDMADRPHPADSEGAGLATALRALCADWQAAQGDRAVRVVCAVDDRNVPKSLWLTICRIVHESLHDTAWRSSPESVGITLVPGDKALLLAIEQGAADGATAVAPAGSSSAVLMMRELAEFSGGTFHFDALPDGGSTLEVLWSRPSTFSQLVVVPTPVH